MTRRIIAAAALALGAGCASAPTLPPQTGPVRLTAAINRAQIARGGTATVSFRLQNVTSRAVTLEFGTGCQVMPYVLRSPANEVVYPEGGGWVCTMALTEMTLAPNSVTVTELTVLASDPPADPPGLPPGRFAFFAPPGEYAFFARLESRQHTIESGRVTLVVR